MITKDFAQIMIEPGFPDPEPEPVIVLNLEVFIDEPDPNEDVTSPVVVTGRVVCTGVVSNPPAPPSDPFDAIGMVQHVQVKFGNGSFETATTSDGWRHWSISRSRSQGTTSITAKATAQVINPPFPPGVVETTTDQVTVNNIFVDTSAPSLTVNSPQDADEGPPYQVAISGSASDNRAVKVVRWRLGNGSFKTAANHNSTWSTWNDTVTLPSLGSYEVTVQAEDNAGNVRTKTVTVQAIDITQPNLEITEPHPNDVFTLLGESVTVRVEGETNDTQSTIQTVRWRQPGGSFQSAVPVAPNDWSSWHADVTLTEVGIHTVEVEATDTANQTASATIDINVAEPFESDDPLEVVSPAAYLEDLLTFTTFRINHEGTTDAIGRADLEAAFKQPFDLLTTREFRPNAILPVAQVRLSIEVLRQYLADNGRSLSAETEQAYRRAAYITLLRNLGTSFDELRLARAADNHTRAALADRLGFTLAESRPDILDALTLDPNTLTETNLAALFGLPDTSLNPATLPPAPEPPLIEVERKNHMRQRWLVQDGARRSDFDAGQPIIDPDRVFETDFVDATPGNAAYDLWLERQSWVTATIDSLRTLRDSAATPLAGLEAVFTQAFGASDTIQTLYAAHLAGEDITIQLESLRLTRTGFLVLGRFHQLLLADTPVLEEEWDQIFSIVMQTEKIGQFDTWQAEEQSAEITLSPDFFQSAPSAPLAPFRATESTRREWELTLRARFEQAVTLQQIMLTTIQETEADVLPVLRDALVEKAADPVTDETNLDDIANRLSHELGIDVKASGSQQTTRIHQAIETIQDALFSLRTGRFQNLEPVLGNSLAAEWAFEDGYSEAEFDEEWRWMGTHVTWRTAMLVFGYPENYLLPNLRPEQTNAFRTLIAAVQNQPRLTPTKARDLINGSSNDSYIKALDAEITAALPVQSISDQFSGAAFDAWRLAGRQAFLNADGSPKFESPHEAPLHIQEIFFAVPMLMALQLQKAGHYLAALDWFQLVYAYEQTIEERKIYYGLIQEGDIETIYQRVPASWLLTGMNPHTVVHSRRNAMTQFTLMSLVRCFLDFADSEFTQDTRASLARARSLYLTALDLMGLPEMQQPANEDGEPISPFPPNPLLEALRSHANLNLTKLRNGRNIAGLERQLAVDNVTAASLLPTISANGQINTVQSIPRRATLYRYNVLIDRAKQLTNIAQQIEAALLAAIEKRDNEEYHLLKARQDLQLTDAAVQLQSMRVTEAVSGVSLAELQRNRSQVQLDHFDQLLEAGTSQLEQQMLDSMSDSLKYQRLATAVNDFNTMVSAISFAVNPASALFGNPFANAVQSLNGRAQEASTVASIRQTKASFERRAQEWRLQSQVSRQDVLIGEQQITIAQNHVAVVEQEQFIAEIQSGHAIETLTFLANKFTNAELYEWMSQILLRVYSYFLQQATAMAKLAERQLAFERLEALPAFIRADYWQPPAEIAGVTSTSERLGLTGSTQLQQDIIKLDQYAFESKQRKLQLSQTFSLSQLSPAEFQQFRESGVLQFNTPMEQFDRAFPGHFMRLIKKVRVSLLALVPPVDGVRATLTSSGISRVVIGNDTFQMIAVQRDPEQIAFTAPTNATGLLDLEPDNEMLLPFEGMGVDVAWELQLPKAANQFDFRTIADVLFTIEYTALSSIAYRQQVIQQFDRRISADRMFNFRDTFADQWFDLYNRNQSATPMVVQFDVRRADFPPNLNSLQIEHVLLYFVRHDGVNIEIPVSHLCLTPANETVPLGGGALTVEGRISTRQGSGQAWSEMIGASPVGNWELALDGTLEDGRPVAALFDEEAIEDILLVITYAGETPAWIP